MHAFGYGKSLCNFRAFIGFTSKIWMEATCGNLSQTVFMHAFGYVKSLCNFRVFIGITFKIWMQATCGNLIQTKTKIKTKTKNPWHDMTSGKHPLI
jgi:hypothetical protein